MRARCFFLAVFLLLSGCLDWDRFAPPFDATIHRDGTTDGRMDGASDVLARDAGMDVFSLDVRGID